jgi:hypothetical protein
MALSTPSNAARICASPSCANRRQYARHALARPPSSAARKAVAAFSSRRPALALGEFPKRIAKTGVAETEAARAGRAAYGRLLPLQIRHMDCGCAVSMARMLAIRRAFGEAARRNRALPR